ncbi:MAG: NAD-dependent epimerase/dehydratase family protein [Thermodesulfobacteriota bacterium]
MKVLITGGGGFIGSHLADRILSEGGEVLVIDNYRTGRRDNLESRERLTLVEGTIADKALVDGLFDSFRPDHVVHAACSYHDPDDWAEDSRTNVEGTVHVIRAAERTGMAGRFIYYQTALRYGLVPQEQPITLKHPIVGAGSSYAVSKTAAEFYINMSSLDYITFVLANCYGPRNISGPLPTFYHRLSQGLSCFVTDTRRDFVYVSDLIDVTMLALTGKGRKGSYHVSSGSDMAIKELFDATVSAMSLPADTPVDVRGRNPDDVFTILLDPAQTITDFGWKTQVPLAKGVPATVDYYREYGIRQTFTHLRHEEKK